MFIIRWILERCGCVVRQSYCRKYNSNKDNAVIKIYVDKDPYTTSCMYELHKRLEELGYTRDYNWWRDSDSD